MDDEALYAELEAIARYHQGQAHSATVCAKGLPQGSTLRNLLESQAQEHDALCAEALIAAKKISDKVPH